MREEDRLEPWIDDGNVVLAAEGRYFRVHRSILSSYSEVFKDMFAVPHSADVEEEMIDGCPVIHIHDPVDDVQAMLKAFYDRSYSFFHEDPMPVTILGAFLRLGRKYAIRQLLKEAKSRLPFEAPLTLASMMSTKGNMNLFPRISGNDPFNFMVMNIASEAGLVTPVILAAYYCCIACPPSSIANGYDFDGIRCLLSAPSLRYCLLGQRHLAKVEKQLSLSLTCPASGCGSGSTVKAACHIGLLSAIRSVYNLKCPFSPWIDTWDNSLCPTCRPELRKRYEEMRTKLWKNLPVDLGLGRWEDLDKDVDIP